MVEFKVRKHIKARPEDVFAVATDMPRWAERIRGVDAVELLTDGPMALGTRFRETRVVMNQRATEELEVTAFDPPNAYAVGCENHGCRFHTEVRFTANGSGTDVDLSFEATPLSPMAKVMAGMMEPMIQSAAEALEGDLDDLKSHIESGSERAGL